MPTLGLLLMRLELFTMGSWSRRRGPARKPKPRKAGTTPKPRTIAAPAAPAKAKPSALLDTRVIYCGDNLEQLAKLPDNCIDLIYIDPPFNSNRNYDPPRKFWGETKKKRARSGGEDRHAKRGM